MLPYQFQNNNNREKIKAHTQESFYFILYQICIQSFLVVCQTQIFLDLFMLNLSMKSNVDPKKKCEKAHNDI